MKNFKLEKFLCCIRFETGAEVIGYIGLVLGSLIMVSDILELTDSLECGERPLDICKIHKIGKKGKI